MEITYHEQNGFQIPNLLLPQEPEVHLGKYAELRRAVPRCSAAACCTPTSRPAAKLTEHLAEIEQTAQRDGGHRP